MLLTRPRFGVEIEYTSADLDQYAMADALTNAGLDCEAERYNHETRAIWKLTTDSSCGMELVSPPLWYEDRFAVAEALRVLTRHGARVNENCGLHVHHEWPWIKDQQLRSTETGQRRRQAKERRIVQLYEACLPLLRVVLPDERFSSGVLGTSHTSDSADRFCQWNSGSTSRGSRYRAINFVPLDDRTTIEFRQHHGTLDADQVLAWIELTRQLVHVASTKHDTDNETSIALIFEKLSTTTWRVYDDAATDEGTTLTDIINTISNPTSNTDTEEN